MAMGIVMAPTLLMDLSTTSTDLDVSEQIDKFWHRFQVW